MSDCQHRHGDYFDGFWICGQCFHKLPERPKVLAMVPTADILPWRGDTPPTRQEVVWQADKLTTPLGDTLGRFLAAAVEYLRRRSNGTLHKDDALDNVLDALRDAGEEFGDAGFDWGPAGAMDLVDESIIAYWDEAEDMANA